MNLLSEQQKVALVRGLAAAIIAGGMAFFTAMSTGEREAVVLISIFALPFLGALAWRFGLEGTYDTVRDRRDDQG